MSDHEINVKVGTAIGFVAKLMAVNKQTDYCNNPADAWPIIKDNMISLCAYKRENSGMKKVSWWEADNFCKHITRDDNPLRAAMIVFLMMQDSANVPANSTGSDLR